MVMLAIATTTTMAIARLATRQRQQGRRWRRRWRWRRRRCRRCRRRATAITVTGTGDADEMAKATSEPCQHRHFRQQQRPSLLGRPPKSDGDNIARHENGTARKEHSTRTWHGTKMARRMWHKEHGTNMAGHANMALHEHGTTRTSWHGPNTIALRTIKQRTSVCSARKPFSCEVFAALSRVQCTGQPTQLQFRRTEFMTAAMEVLTEAVHSTTWLWQSRETANNI